MPEPRSLKQGRLYELLGDARALFTPTGAATYPSLFQYTDGTWVLLYVNASANVSRKTGAHLLTVSAADGTQVFDSTNAISQLCAVQDGATTRIWYAQDNGAGQDLIYYRTSADGGATWSAESIAIIPGLAGSWNDVHVHPIGAYKDTGASKWYIHVLGYDGAAWKLGRWEAGTASDLTLLASYTAYASNPIFPAEGTMGGHACAAFFRGQYWMLYGDDATPTVCYYAHSYDGLTWGPQAQKGTPVYTVGITDTQDDANVYPGGLVQIEGEAWHVYAASDGADTRIFAAVGVKPPMLFKVQGLNNTTASTRIEVYQCLGDLTYNVANRWAHIGDRASFGSIVETAVQPMTGSFGMRYIEMGAGGVGAASPAPTFFNTLFRPSSAINEGPTFNVHNPRTLHFLFELLNSSGSREQFFIFPRCVVSPFRFGEGAPEEGDSFNVSFESFGLLEPLHGRF